MMHTENEVPYLAYRLEDENGRPALVDIGQRFFVKRPCLPGGVHGDADTGALHAQQLRAELLARRLPAAHYVFYPELRCIEIAVKGYANVTRVGDARFCEHPEPITDCDAVPMCPSCPGPAGECAADDCPGAAESPVIAALDEAIGICRAHAV